MTKRLAYRFVVASRIADHEKRWSAPLVLALGLGIFCAVALGADRPARLLLTPRRLHRLKLDAQRQTPRWMDFANRVKTVPDSPQRGFELALYSVVTGDPKSGKEAVQWAAAHPCNLRQDALIRDWLGGVPDAASCSIVETDDKKRSSVPQSRSKGAYASGSVSAEGNQRVIVHARDLLFQAIAKSQNAEAVYKAEWKPMLAKLEAGAFRDPRALYAAVEFIDAVRLNLHINPREDAHTFFAQLPVEFLLSLKPEQVEHPGWRAHAAALALVTLDPNLPASQYLQGWAMENRQMVRAGPGVAYEFLWADPYLPGIGYQNLDPWVYDPHGRLFARKNWSANACWIEISAKGVQEQNCPVGWRAKPASFGRLMLIPMDQKCLTVTPALKDHAAIVWHLPPGQKLRFKINGKRDTAHADSIGLWRVAGAARGKVCLAR